MKIDMTTTLTTALSGLQVGINNAQQASNEVAKLTTGSKDVQAAIGPLLKLQEAEQQVAVTSKVIAVEGEALGRFVDESA
ncbi:MAG: hypothetical protein QM484_04085 [Woeseiaceae bacterium]